MWTIVPGVTWYSPAVVWPMGRAPLCTVGQYSGSQAMLSPRSATHSLTIAWISASVWPGLRRWPTRS